MMLSSKEVGPRLMVVLGFVVLTPGMIVESLQTCMLLSIRNASTATVAAVITTSYDSENLRGCGT